MFYVFFLDSVYNNKIMFFITIFDYLNYKCQIRIEINLDLLKKKKIDINYKKIKRKKFLAPVH